jgi:hypothetical protein
MLNKMVSGVFQEHTHPTSFDGDLEERVDRPMETVNVQDASDGEYGNRERRGQQPVK